MKSMDKYIGKKLDGRYEIRELIGVGGMAMVYKAYDSIDDRVVAIKILREEFASNEEFRRRFKNESKAIAILSHPNIVKVYDVSFGDTLQYIAMEYVDGITLKEYIEQQGTLRWQEAVHFTVQILKALEHAHKKGIIHRDIKPQNIILLQDGTIKVADFGIARFSGSGQRTMTEKAIGSVHYISPEQARGDEIDEKTDVYSVGVILYEMLSGKLPFESDSAVSVAIMQVQANPASLKQMNPSVPDGLEQITMKAMQKEPSQRYQSASEMLSDIEAFRNDPDIRFNYRYFVDNEPTKYVPSVKAKLAAEQEEEEPKKTNIIPILSGIAGAVIVVAAIFVIFMVIKVGFGQTGNYDTTAPDLIGKSYNDIINDPEYSQYSIVSKTTAYNSEYEAGLIFDQAPSPGRPMKSNKPIEIMVSLGAEKVVMPDIVNERVDTAVSMLQGMGLKVKQLYKYDDHVTKDYIITSRPSVTEDIAAGQSVVLVVSRGPAGQTSYVPSVVNLSSEDARRRILECGLAMGEITHQDSDKPEGVVLAQTVAAGDRVAGKTAVSLTVSSGNRPSQTRTLNIPLPDENRVVTVSVEQDGVNIYKENVRLKDKKKLNIDIKGSGTSKINVIFNGDGLNDFMYMTFTFDLENNSYSDVKTNPLPKKEISTTQPTTHAEEPTTSAPDEEG